MDDLYSKICTLKDKYPHKKAVCYGTDYITYNDLVRTSDIVAAQLYKQEIRPGDAVAIYMNPSIIRIIAMLAVIKIGAAYVPLDPIQPKDRRNYICDDAEVKCILVDKIDDEIPNGKKIIIERNPTDNHIIDSSNYYHHKDSENICYIIYTSGTTGKPKGVCITQKNVAVYAANQYCVQVREDHVFAHASNFAFDPTTLEIWVPLLNASTIVVLDKYVITMPQQLHNVIKTYNINFIWLTSSIFNYLLDNGFVDFRALDYVIIGGEPVSIKHVRRLVNSSLMPKHLINGYGLTETTVLSFYYDIKSVPHNAKSIPIGKPLNNEQALVLTHDGRKAKIEESGELYILGDGIGKGYLKFPKNQEDPFTVLQLDGKPIRAYKTGDIVKTDKNGFYYFLDRIDHQIKINGFRVEPNEIINCVEENQTVMKALIKDFPDQNGNHRLVIYVSLKKDDDRKTDAWRNVYEDIYSVDNDFDARENFSGWKNSLTRENFSRAEMQNWLNSAIKNITSMSPEKILEIGSGTGLLLFKLWDKCEHYTAVDFSQTAIKLASDILKNDKDAKQKVTLLNCEADKIQQIFAQSCKFDLIILNSVIQYFPNIDYFERVIAQATALLTDDGVIYIGDIRDYSLLKLFYAQKYKTKNEIEHAVTHENELCIAPAYFYSSNKRMENLTCKMVHQRTFRDPIELSRYRYDVFLSLNNVCIDKSNDKLEINVVDCLSDNFCFDKINKSNFETIHIKNIINESILTELDGFSSDVKNYLTQTLNSVSQVMYSPEKISELFSNRYSSIFVLRSQKGGLYFDMILTSKNIEKEFYNNLSFQDDINIEIKMFNDVKACNMYVSEKDIFRSISAKLPHYMLPEMIIIIPEMKTNVNGKYDLSTLQNPFSEDTEFSNVKHIEQLDLREIINRISYSKIDYIADDVNLISIGLDSLDFLKLISMIEDNFNVRLSLTQILKMPTINKIQQAINEMLLTAKTPKILKSKQPLLHLPLLPNQIEKYFEHQDKELKNVNNIVYGISYEVNFHLERLIDAINIVYTSYSALRINVYEKDNNLYQKINNFTSCDIKIVLAENYDDYSEMKTSETKLLQLQDISLEQDRLFKCTIIKHKDMATLLIYFHHILLDLQSLENIVKKLNAIYITGYQYELNARNDTYEDFILDQVRHISSDNYKKNVKSIADTLYNINRELILDNYKTSDCLGDYVATEIPNKYISAIKAQVKKHNVTNFTFYLTVFQMTLQEFFKKDNFTVGITSSARLKSSTQDTIGLINNYLIVPCVKYETNDFNEILASVYASVLKAFSQIEYNNYDILKSLQAMGDQNKLFNLFFDYNNMSNISVNEFDQKNNINILGLQPNTIVNRIISIRVTEKPSITILSIRFRKKVLNEQVIRKLSEKYIDVLARQISIEHEFIHDPI
ncbi:MAG TPA: amino acid adenylation domain-containing protein [Gammaproteobacteria bacterium]|nr:amino acid adenylation domain-containing protein [Gammaproteobacteria bacterium]